VLIKLLQTLFRLLRGHRGSFGLLVASVAGVAMVVPSSAFAAIGWSAPVPIDSHANQTALTSISCPPASLNQQGTSFCMAVDDGGNNYDGHDVIYDGASWSAPQLFDSVGNYGPDSVSCLSSSLCTVVDGAGNGLTYNGSSWASANVSSGSLSAVSCASSAFCMAVEGNAFAYNGSSWSPPWNGCVNNTSACGLGSSNGEIFLSVSCPSSSFCAAAGHNGGAATYDGGGWNGGAYNGYGWTFDGQIDTTDGDYSLHSVSCTSSSFCVAVDGNGSAYTYDGSAWSGPVRIDPNGGGLSSVSCVSSSFCVAVDGAGNALMYNGSSWSSQSIDPNGQGLTAVSCASTSFCMATDTAGHAVEYGPLPAGLGTSALTLVGRLRVTADGVITRVSCTGSAPCVATETLTTTVRATGRGHHLADSNARSAAVRTVVVGTRRVTIAAGRSVTITTTLNAVGRRLLRRLGKLRVAVELTMRRGGHLVVVARRGATIRAAVRGRRPKR